TQCALPRGPLVGHIAVEHRQRRCLLATRAEFDEPEDRGGVGEVVLLGEVAADLDLGMRALIKPAEDLQDQLVTEDVRRVCLLLAARRGGRERLLPRQPRPPQGGPRPPPPPPPQHPNRPPRPPGPPARPPPH